MRVALHHPSAAPRLARVFADGLRTALASAGHDAFLCGDSDTVIARAPDLVMIVDPACPKLTDHFTVGFVWESFATVERRIDWHGPISSWDLAVCTSPDVRDFLRDIQHPARDGSAVSQRSVYPDIVLEPPRDRQSGGPVAIVRDTPLFEDPARHREFFTCIAARVPLQAYGPDELWGFLGPAHAGPAPDSLVAAGILARHRAILALTRQPAESGHVESTLFLAASAARLAVTNIDRGTAELFGPDLGLIDLDHDPRDVADHIAASLEPTRAAPRLPAAWGLADRLPPLLDEIAALRACVCATPALGTVSVIIRCGGRPLDFARRAVASVARQAYPQVALVLVAYAGQPAFEALVAELRADPRWTQVRSLFVAGGGRSATLWTALATIDTPLFAVLDDDDEYFHDHLSSLAAALACDPQAMVAHSGTIHVEEGCFPPAPDNPPPPGAERRTLLYMTPFDPEAAMRLEHKVQSNSWLARREVLSGPLLDDPGLNYGEDLYLFMMMVARHPYVFTGRASAIYNWRSLQADSSLAESPEVRAHHHRRMLHRLMQVPFHAPALGATIYRRSVASAPDADRLGRPTRYESSLADGIHFARPGMPDFVSTISGLSQQERWGRWTIGPQLRVVFRTPLPDAFCLMLRARASRHNAGRRLTIRAGACTRQVTFAERDRDLVLAFAHTGEPEVLTIDIPNPAAPNGLDSRPIGLGLVHLAILPPGRKPARVSPVGQIGASRVLRHSWRWLSRTGARAFARLRPSLTSACDCRGTLTEHGRADGEDGFGSDEPARDSVSARLYALTRTRPLTEAELRRSFELGLAVGSRSPFPAAVSDLSPAQPLSLRHLLSLDDHAFLEAAYVTLLRRPPDEAGQLHYLSRLASARSRPRVLGELRYSAEGRLVGAVLPGLRRRYLLHSLSPGFLLRRLLRIVTPNTRPPVASRDEG